MIARLTAKRQLTLPAKALAAVDCGTGLFRIHVQNGWLLLMPVKLVPVGVGDAAPRGAVPASRGPVKE